MKKVISLLLTIICLTCVLTACLGNNEIDADTVNPENLTDPFDTSEIDKSIAKDVKKIGSYGMGIHNRQETYIYNGEDVEIPVELNNLDIPLEIGIMIYVDGIPQEILIKEDDDNSKQFIKKVNLTGKGIVIKTAVFKPNVGKKGDVLNLHVVTMLNPSYMPEGTNKSYGNQHSILDIFPVELKYTADGTDSEYKIKYIEKELMTEKIRQAFQLEDGEISNGIELYSDDPGKYRAKPYLTYKKGENIELKLALYGSEMANYRTTIFVNHNPIKTLEGYSYHDMLSQDKYISITDLSIDEVSKDSIIYAVAVPIGENIDESSCIKTRTCMLLSEKQEEEVLKELEGLNNESEIMEEEISSVNIENTQDAKIIKENENLGFSSLLGIDKNNNIYAVSKDFDSILLIDAENHNVINTIELTEPNEYKFTILDDGFAVIVSDENNEESEAEDSTNSDGFIGEVVDDGSERTISYEYYDSNLNLQNTVDITSLFDSGVSLDVDDILVINNGKEFLYQLGRKIYKCKTDLSEKTLIKDNSLIFRMKYCNELIAFMSSNLDDDNTAYIGTVKLDGSDLKKYEIPYCGKSSYATGGTQIAGSTALWHDEDVMGNVVTSGIVRVITDGKMKEIETGDKTESENVTLSNDGKVFATYIADKNNITIRIYDINAGEKLNEINDVFELEPKVPSMIVTSDTVYVVDKNNAVLKTYKFK